MPETLTLSEFIDRHNITAEVEPATDNPQADGFGPEAVHFTVTLHRGDSTMAVPFSGGSEKAFARSDGQPTVVDVLYCLYADSASADQPFEDWADEYGYDADSRRAYATWEAVNRQLGQLAAFLGAELLAEFLTVSEAE
jgi:hypothetical protein